MKKLNSLMFSAFLMVLFASISFTSCNKDDDDEDGLFSIENKYWAFDEEGSVIKFQNGLVYSYFQFENKAIVFNIPDMDLSGPVGTYKIEGNKLTLTVDNETSESTIESCDSKKLVLVSPEGFKLTIKAQDLKEVKLTDLSEEEYLKLMEIIGALGDEEGDEE